MCSIVAHMVIENVCLRNTQFLAKYDPLTQQNTIVLREIVYILLTTREIIKGLFQEKGESKLNEIGHLLIQGMAYYEKAGRNIFTKNYQ